MWGVKIWICDSELLKWRWSGGASGARSVIPNYCWIHTIHTVCTFKKSQRIHHVSTVGTQTYSNEKDYWCRARFDTSKVIVEIIDKCRVLYSCVAEYISFPISRRLHSSPRSSTTVINCRDRSPSVIERLTESSWWRGNPLLECCHLRQ